MNLQDLETVKEWDRTTPPHCSAEIVARWFPAIRPHDNNLDRVVICIHNSGSTESMYTGTHPETMHENPFMRWSRQHRVQVLAVQLPGRGERQGDEMYESIQAAAIGIYEVVRHRLTRAGVQFAIVAHSMGCWVAYELALHLQEMGYVPVGMCLSCFPSPSIDPSKRPWKTAESTYFTTHGEHDHPDDRERKWSQALDNWDVDPRVLRPTLWAKYGTAIEGDFRMLCGYQRTLDHQSALLHCALLVFHADRDRMVSRAHVSQWKAVHIDTCMFRIHSIVNSNHMFVNNYAASMVWLAECSRFLDTVYIY
jgi:surfactin synthase thioesterase subunit